jgi:uncharacterized membrane protein YtjA (UPF0391 family)
LLDANQCDETVTPGRQDQPEIHAAISRGPMHRLIHIRSKENAMLSTLSTLATTGFLAQVYANNLIWLGIVFFVISIVAYVLGARGVAGMSAGLGRTLLIVGVILAIVIIVFGYVGHPA